MGTFRGYMINVLRINGIAMFVILQVLCVYFLIVGLEEISAPLQSLWYTAAYDGLITSGAIIALKEKNQFEEKEAAFTSGFLFMDIYGRRKYIAFYEEYSILLFGGIIMKIRFYYGLLKIVHKVMKVCYRMYFKTYNEFWYSSYFKINKLEYKLFNKCKDTIYE